MNAERLLAHYEQIADAHDAIARLRRFILDLAVRGKLVPQDPGDEPASELLKRIANEKARLVKAGEVREPNSFVRINREALPFQPAPHWGWARLIEIARPSYGFAFASSNFNSAKRGMPLIRIRDISGTDAEAYFDGDYDPTYLVTAGDYLVGMDGDFNLRRWRGVDGLLNQRVMRINGWRCGIDPEFVKLPLQFVLDHLHGQTSLTTVKHLSAKQVNGIEIPLPPLAEQHRIVAKVDELMGLCDRLEAAREAREMTRNRLAASSLARLNAPDPDTYQTDTRFVLNALPAITTRPDQIKRLRQTILNLAVRGKLVPQDPNDEPASELLKRIAKEKARLVKAGEIRRPKELSFLDERELPFAVPTGWTVAPLDGLSPRSLSDGDWIETKDQSEDGGVRLIQLADVGVGEFLNKSARYVTEETEVRLNCTRLAVGDILIARLPNPIGRACIFSDIGQPAITAVDVAILRPDSNVSAEFLVLAMNAPPVREQIEAYGKGATRFRVSTGHLKTVQIPLPPLAEQRRIVAKVDELMGLCDRLEASLDQTAATRRRLLDALLAEALAPETMVEEAA